MSVDPITADPNTGAKFNRYAYALNNPYKFTDPDGRDEERAYGAGVAIALRNSPERLETVRQAEIAAGRGQAVDGIDGGKGMVEAVRAVANGGGVKEVAAAVTTAAAGAVIRGKSGRQGDFTRGEKREAKRDNAARNDGQMKCTDCGKSLDNVASQKGVSTPPNQAQVHHDPAIQNGGGRHSTPVVLCPECHKDRHK